MRRSFNSGERATLFHFNNGKCSLCGDPLSKGWHADHIIPFSRGGRTDVVNGQALCAECNLKKGDKYMEGLELRAWQQNAYNKWVSHNKDTFLCVACPGAGKTTYALTCANYFYQNKNNLLILVCHTAHLKRQWADDAYRLGICLDYKFENGDGAPAPDFHGICITYHMLQRNPLIYRKLSSRYNTLVILDEVHHLGDGREWGDAAYEAFSKNGQKLALSGTPIRTGNERIPFVDYRDIALPDGRKGAEAIPDFSYSYIEAQEDGVCRPVFFPSFNGNMEWVSKDFNTYSCSFTDDIPDGAESERLRTALDPNGDWLFNTLTDANSRLDSIRESGHRNAGGIVFARDSITSHAQAIRQMLVEITGNPHEVEIATSEETFASDAIKSFSSNSKKWIVSVRMVSEGVDIPRLRVGVHATNYTTELFFRQAVGRICRYQVDVEDNIGQAAFYYIPADERLVSYAENITKEVKHVIYHDDELDDPTGGRDSRVPPVGANIPRYEPISSTGFEDRIIADIGGVYTKDELTHARQILSDLNKPLTYDMLLVEAIRRHDEIKQSCPTITQAHLAGMPKNKTDKKVDLRKEINKRVGRVAFSLNLDFQDVHNKLNNIIGTNQKRMTEDSLKQKLDLVKKWESTGEI